MPPGTRVRNTVQVHYQTVVPRYSEPVLEPPLEKAPIRSGNYRLYVNTLCPKCAESAH